MDNSFYRHRGLFTDLYQLTMTQAYFETGKNHKITTFELFIRSNPFNGGYTVVAGIEDALNYLNALQFHEDDIKYLQGQNLFSTEFLNYLQELKFTGHVEGVLDGSIIFPYEPIIQLTGELGQLQLIETALLNIINYQTLIATKASRVSKAAHPGTVIEFGLRRAQGDGGIVGSRSAMIGGCIGTSNVLAGKIFQIPISGTHAHSFIQSFDTELEAFRTYAKIFPKRTILLVDTYDVLRSGMPNAIKVGKEMEEQGANLFGIRIDSGDLAWLTLKSAEMLDAAGLQNVKIVLSNDLDEYIIESILRQIKNESKFSEDLKFRESVAKRLVYGVGTNLITGGSQSALGGVYKITEYAGRPVIKISENTEKTTNPGKKKVWRLKSNNGTWIGDVIGLFNEEPPKSGDTLYHPIIHSKFYVIQKEIKVITLIQDLYIEGKIFIDETWKTAQKRHQSQINTLDTSHTRFLNPHMYKVSLSKKLFQLKNELIQQYKP